MVPNVIKPTSAWTGRRERLMIMESFNAFIPSPSRQVSRTKRKIGGDGAGRASRYSIVVLVGRSSGGTASAEMSL
jgi:hypothetical protein